MEKSKQANITMAPGEEKALQVIAERLETVCRYGSSAGKITWRELIHQIAWGHLVVSRPGVATPKPDRQERRERRKKSNDKPYKAYAKYPHKWWLPDAMNMMLVTDVVAASGRTAEELEAGGLTRHDEWFIGLPEWSDRYVTHSKDDRLVAHP